MKNLIVFFCILFISCDKSEPQADLVGTWTWVSSNGGIAGLNLKPKQGQVRLLTFYKDGYMDIIENNTIIFSAKYEIGNAKSITSQTEVPMIIFPNEDSMNWSYSIVGDELNFFEEVYDGFGHTYIKVE